MHETLSFIASKYDTDKKERLSDLYEKFVQPIKYSVKSMIEIGVDKGESIKMWIEYFPNLIEILAMDIDHKTFDNTKIKFYQGDQGITNNLKNLISLSNVGEFDFIIDDGSHCHDHQHSSLAYLFLYLKSGGLYAIEDLLCKKRFSNKKQLSIAKTLSRYEVTKIFKSDFLTENESRYITDNLMEYHVFDNNLAILKKK